MAGIRVAVTDDWQNAAREVTDWSELQKRAEIVFFPRHYAAADEDQAAHDLKDFDIILPTRERSRFSESLIARLPKLKMMSLTGSRAPNVDQDACTKRGIICTFTSGGHSPAPAAEMIAVWREDNESPLLATFRVGLTKLVREGFLAHRQAA